MEPTFRPDGPVIQRPWLRAVVIFGAWWWIALLFSVSNVMRATTVGMPVDWFRAAWVPLTYWSWWAVATLAITRLVRRVWISRESWSTSVPVHLVLSLVVGPLHLVLTNLTQERLAIVLGDSVSRSPLAETVTYIWSGSVPLAILGVFKYWLIVSVYVAFLHYHDARRQALRASRLEAELATAQLEALRMQLHPHFLFNALHSVSMLQLEDGQAANRVLVKLSELLRAALDRPEQEVPLEEELDFIQRYLEIEQLRFQDRLEVEWRLDGMASSAAVPNLILQPVVENAVRHGISRDATAGRITIDVAKLDNRLRIRVEDDGPGFPDDWNPPASFGIGLRNTASRLAMLYGEDARLAFENGEGRGTTVLLDLPFREFGVSVPEGTSATP